MSGLVAVKTNLVQHISNNFFRGPTDAKQLYSCLFHSVQWLLSTPFGALAAIHPWWGNSLKWPLIQTLPTFQATWMFVLRHFCWGGFQISWFPDFQTGGQGLAWAAPGAGLGQSWAGP